MLYKIAICDDEENQVNIVKKYLVKFSIKTDIEFKVECFSRGDELLNRYYEESAPFDLLFLDMEMPGENGLGIAERIRHLPDRNVLIVFITNYPEYMKDSFDVQAFQFLVKPVSYEFFEDKLEKMLTYINALETSLTVLSQKNGETVLYVDDIVCIESGKKNGLIITTKNGEIAIRGKLAEYENKLKDNYFISVHRVCLANMRYIKKFNADCLEFSNGKVVPVSRRRYSEIKSAFSKYMIMRIKR